MYEKNKIFVKSQQYFLFFFSIFLSFCLFRLKCHELFVGKKV